MSKKLIAIDLDGTTLNNQSSLSLNTKNVIQTLSDQGHIVVISTGRPYRNSTKIYQELALNTPMINFNGAYCHKPNDYQWTKDMGYHKPIQRELALEMLRYKDEKEIQLISAESRHTVYASGDFVPYSHFYSNGSIDFTPFKPNKLTENPTSVNVFTHSHHFQEKIQKKVVSTFGDDVEIRTWGGYAPCLEIVAKGVQKALGIEHLAHYYNIKASDVIAFGDEDNDYEMIQYAGHGVAMKNAIPELKEIASTVTDYTNDEDGLARYLNEYFDLNKKML